MKILAFNYPNIEILAYTDPSERSKLLYDIKSGISTREIVKNLVKVRSSNVWSYGINIKHNGDETGDVYTQFKDNNGGPGDIYVYYNVPVKIYRRWVSTPSKGHFFWKNIRNQFNYSKLTGDRRGKLKNAVN